MLCRVAHFQRITTDEPHFEEQGVFFNPFASEAVYTRNPTAFRTACKHAFFFWELGRKPCQHATRGCDKHVTCIHAGVSRSPREHASVPPDIWLPSGNGGMEWVNGFLLIPLSTTSVDPGTNLWRFVIHCLWCLSGMPSIRPARADNRQGASSLQWFQRKASDDRN